MLSKTPGQCHRMCCRGRPSESRRHRQDDGSAERRLVPVEGLLHALDRAHPHLVAPALCPSHAVRVNLLDVAAVLVDVDDEEQAIEIEAGVPPPPPPLPPANFPSVLPAPGPPPLAPPPRFSPRPIP